MLRVDLSGAATAALHGALQALPPPGAGLEDLLARLLQTSSHLPCEFLASLLALRAGVDVPGTLLVTGMPIDADLPPTPIQEPPQERDAGGLGIGGPGRPGPVSERALLLAAVLLGEPVAYQGEKNGTLVQDVFPIRALESTPSNDGSAIDLGFHSELTFSREAPERPLHLTCPDFVLLLGLRCPAERGATTVTVEARAVCSRLKEHHLASLRQPQFQLRAPHSFTRDGGTRPWSQPVPLVRGTGEATSLAFDSACGVQALSSEAAEALDALRAACDDPTIQNRVQLGRGDLLVIDNNRCVHARSRYRAEYDGRDRWLRRVYVRRSIWQLTLASAGSSRVLA